MTAPRVELMVPSWTDISSYVYQRDTLQIQRGRQNEASTMQAGSCALTLDNRTGRFTPRNPAGAYWPNLVQNTPLRVSVPASAAGLPNYLRLETDLVSSAATPDSASLRITGPIDVRVDCWPTDYQQSVLAAKWGGTAQSWMLVLNAKETLSQYQSGTPATGSPGYVATATLAFIWYDGVSLHYLDSGQQLPWFGQRIALRCLFTPSTGTAVFYTAPTMAGSWTQLGITQIFGATTLSGGTGQLVQVGGGPVTVTGLGAFAGDALTFNSLSGAVYEFQLLSNVTLEADPVFTGQAAGTASFADAQSNTWTLTANAEISDRLYRYHGETGNLPKAVDPSGQDVYSQATAYGIVKRLQNSNVPLQSPMRRAYVRLPSSLNLAGYWPCEDGTNATTIGSAVSGPALTILGSPTLASNSSFKCSNPIPAMNSGTFIGSVPAPPGGTDAVIRFLVSVPAAGDTNNAIWMQAAYSGGTSGIAAATLVYTTGGFLNMSVYNASGGLIASTGNVGFSVNGTQLRVSMNLKKNGGNVDMETEVLAPGAVFGNQFTSSSVAAGTVGQVVRVQAGSLSSPTTCAIGHISVQGTWDTLFDVAGALDAWFAEPAAARVARICAEEGIRCRICGPLAASVPMGYQAIDTLYNILQQCENTDLGMLFEPRQALGVGYRTRSSMYHQAALAVAAYSSAQIFQGFGSTADTQLTVNDVTANAPSGSTARQFLATGPMSIQAPPNGIGRVDTQIQPNPQLDQSLTQIASWHLSVRSVDDDRYPGIPFELNRTETPSAVLLLDTGDYLQLTGTQSWLPPPPVRQLCAGFGETFLPVPSWVLDVNGIPELPYETATLGPSHFDTLGSTLTSGITNSATSFQVTTTAGPVWVQSGSFPFDITVDREQMTVTAITSATSPQTFTVTRSVNGVVLAHSAGAAVALYNKPVYSL